MTLGLAGSVMFGVGTLGTPYAEAHNSLDPPVPDATFVRAESALTQTEAPEREEAASSPRPDINPYNRDIEITAPIQFNQRVLGELPVLLTADDRFIIGSEAFLALIQPLVTPEAYSELDTLIGTTDRFAPEMIEPTGIVLDYDPEQLAVLVIRIAPEKRSVEALYRASTPEEPGAPPLPFSAYLNMSGTISRLSQDGGIQKPDIFANGAIRFNDFVFEADGQLRRDFATNAYQIERRFARLIYDQPDNYRRFLAGDLDPETRGRQGFFNMGGVGVVRQRRRFDAFRNNVFSGGRQLVLQEQSTVRVIRNGIFQREFTLDPGQYDISNLPLDTGSNDIQIEVEGLSGVRQSYDYQAYLDTIDLEPGDHEYGAYFGFLDESGFSNPDYSSLKPVFTGFFRKAFLNRPAIGVGLQFSEDVQNVTGQTQLLLLNGSRLRFDLGASNSNDGFGYAATAGYDQIIGGADGYDTLSLVVDYASARYATVGGFDDINPISWNVNAAYTKRVNFKLFVTTSASYRMSRSPLLRDSYSISSVANYRFNREWSLQFGGNYTKSGFTSSFSQSDGFGVSVGLIWQPRYDRRAEARYNTNRNIGSVRYQQTTSNRAGSFGYSLNGNYNDGANSIGGQLDYVGNRFDANLTHSAFGESFNSIGRDNITTFRLSSAIAYTGGELSLSRTINDSFAMVRAHESLRGRTVVVGDSLEGGEYVSRSGAFGPAVQNNLNSFLNQSIRYDVLDPPLGYDIGDGVMRVRPGYKSGYLIEVGSAAFVSALGRLQDANGEPISLVSGVMRRVDDPEAPPEAFFTNTVGRFAIAKLEPGKEYRVEILYNGRREFTFRVPDDNEGLLDLGVVQLR